MFSPYSHNRRYGEAFVTGELGELAEGTYTVKALVRLGEEHGVSLPFARQWTGCSTKGGPPPDPGRAVSRSLKQEF